MASQRDCLKTPDGPARPRSPAPRPRGIRSGRSAPPLGYPGRSVAVTDKRRRAGRARRHPGEDASCAPAAAHRRVCTPHPAHSNWVVRMLPPSRRILKPSGRRSTRNAPVCIASGWSSSDTSASPTAPQAGHRRLTFQLSRAVMPVIWRAVAGIHHWPTSQRTGRSFMPHAKYTGCQSDRLFARASGRWCATADGLGACCVSCGAARQARF
jgi:hypothetical protein